MYVGRRSKSYKKINKNIGDEVEFSTAKLKVLNCDEKQVLSKKHSGPYIASEEAKFVVIEIVLAIITTSTFSFTDNIVDIDNKNR